MKLRALFVLTALFTQIPAFAADQTPEQKAYSDASQAAVTVYANSFLVDIALNHGMVVFAATQSPATDKAAWASKNYQSLGSYLTPLWIIQRDAFNATSTLDMLSKGQVVPQFNRDSFLKNFRIFSSQILGSGLTNLQKRNNDFYNYLSNGCTMDILGGATKKDNCMEGIKTLANALNNFDKKVQALPATQN